MVKAFKVMVLFVLISVALVVAAGPAAAADESTYVACWNNCGVGDTR